MHDEPKNLCRSKGSANKSNDKKNCLLLQKCLPLNLHSLKRRKMKQLIISMLLAACTIVGVGAQDMAELFVKMPNEYTIGLEDA